MENEPKAEDNELKSDSEPYMIMPDANSSSMRLVLEGSDTEKEIFTPRPKRNDPNIIHTSQCCTIY